jgi:hypothetical protein
MIDHFICVVLGSSKPLSKKKDFVAPNHRFKYQQKPLGYRENCLVIIKIDKTDRV